MNLELTSDQRDRILGFLGYGNLSAPVWFVGLEEGLGGADDEQAARSLQVRGAFAPAMDLRQGCLNDFDIEKDPLPRTQTWRWMAKIMLARNGETDWWGKVEPYIRERLGRSEGETFLTELSPIPSRTHADKRRKEWFKKNEPLFEDKLEKRQKELRSMLKDRAVRGDAPLVICYGNGHRDRFAEFFGIEWKPVCEDIERSTDSRFLLLPFLGCGQMKSVVMDKLLEHRLLYTEDET
ncbi:MAG: hypothetical protein EOM62_14515 [Bacteroidia bacterium]|jgi:hypothetical protein|nr:hypothetical protein [Bacteroidia bacterium]